MSTIGDRIKIARGSMNQADFGKIAGISQRTVGHYEKNERTPDAEFLAKICSGLNISPEWLLLGVGPKAKTADVGNFCQNSRSQPVENITSQKKELPTVGSFSADEGLAKVKEELLDQLRENNRLLKEVAELKEAVARLEKERARLLEDLERLARSAEVRDAGLSGQDVG
ncbi:helix-turn-helix domain-containing protein [Desulfovibrio sp. OttesenSCG-928-C14]|nr:helix-turn-helix domain-containing protein [Desulfovibrio sp. OttesenSCG-928-C14]